MRIPLPLFLFAMIAALPAAARADVLVIEKDTYEGTINGIRNGKISISIKGVARQFDVDKIASLAIDGLPRLTEAEEARQSDPKKSAALYKSVIATINKPELRLLAVWRAIEPTDKDGRWNEAVALFLEVYQASPTDAIWSGRPSHWPGGTSAMLTEGAERVGAAIKVARSDEVKKNLRRFQLDIFTRAGNTQEAQRLARELDTGLADEAVIAPPTAAVSSPILDTAGLTALLAGKDFAAAIQKVDAALPRSSGESAAQLFSIKAQALEGQGKLADAAATWLRIAAHYPASPTVPAALLNAARLEKAQKFSSGARFLLDELRQKYPESKEAAQAAKE